MEVTNLYDTYAGLYSTCIAVFYTVAVTMLTAYVYTYDFYDYIEPCFALLIYSESSELAMYLKPRLASGDCQHEASFCITIN